MSIRSTLGVLTLMVGCAGNRRPCRLVIDDYTCLGGCATAARLELDLVQLRPGLHVGPERADGLAMLDGVVVARFGRTNRCGVRWRRHGATSS